MKVNCPSCKSIDMIQKVTAIVEGETLDTKGESTTKSSSKISGNQDFYARVSGSEKNIGRGDISGQANSSSSTFINTTQQSRLARKLTPPLRPYAPYKPELDTDMSKVGDYATKGALIIGVVMFLLLGSLLGFDSWITIVISIVTFIVASVPLSIFIEGKMEMPEEEKKKILDKYNTQLKLYKRVYFPSWEVAMNRWNEMFYCRRCDVIFVPGDDIAPMSTNEINKLCYHGTDSELLERSDEIKKKMQQLIKDNG